MHRFFLLDQSLVVGQTVDLSTLAHQLVHVLRLETGAQILLLDNHGTQFTVRLQTLGRNQATGFILSQQREPAEPTVRVALYQCSLKADKFEWILQKGTELGVARFVPVISERSIVRPATALLKRYERWRAILREAAEQCGRGCIPALDEPLSLPQAQAQATGLRLTLWEAAAEVAAPGLGTILQQQPRQWSAGISLLLGPEGGFTQAEVMAAQNTGWQTASLGLRILRAETAALAAISVVMEHCGELGAGAQPSTVGLTTASPT